MRKLLCAVVSLLILCGYAMGQSRRPIDSKHPMWLVHIDVWNCPDPQKIIDLIPSDVKPYVVLNLSLSSSYDTTNDVYNRPQNGVATYKSWASVCQANDMWFTCQPSSGGHTHIHDNDIETFEYFFKKYPNFLGWNFAEQFWGFDIAGDKSSSSQVERLALFAKLVEMSHQYGGFLTISYCGNIWTHNLNPVAMMKRNNDLYNACAQYPESILWLYKYTTRTCFYNNESVTFGPFVSGLASNYGVRYDNCGFDSVLDYLLGDDNTCIYPENAGIGTVMEQMGVNGGAVWDGPELIWQQDFRNLPNTTVSGYTRRNWDCYPGFTNVWVDMFRKVMDGTIYIPTRSEVVEKTKIILVNDAQSGSSQDLYATPTDLYDGLYKQTDPFNSGTGQLNDNGLYLKSTGRYGTIPVTLALNDDAAKGIPQQVTSSKLWSTEKEKVADFNRRYAQVSKGDLYVNRFKNQLITYTPYSYLNSTKKATGVIPLQYNSCDSITMTLGKLCSATVREYSDHIDFYLNNFRSDTTSNVTELIVVDGVNATPKVTYTKREDATLTVNYQYDSTGKTLTVYVAHNGPVDLTLTCSGNAVGRKTDVADSSALTADLPTQPEPLADGKIIIEAEDMDFKDLPTNDNCIVEPYNKSKYKDERGHVGNGFMHIGTSKSAALTHALTRKAAGDYRMYIRYNTEVEGGQLTVTANGSTQTVSCPYTGNNVWKKVLVNVTMKAGSNRIRITNSGGKDMLIDNVTYIPSTEENERYPIVIRDAVHGTATASVSEAEEGENVQLSVSPESGYIFVGWEIIHGDINIDDENCFDMPDDIVTLTPLFSDESGLYSMEFAEGASIPVGWRCVQENDEVHEYPNAYTSGSRTFTGLLTANGKNKALYWRDGYAEYGRQIAYPLTLHEGSYKLAFSMAAWKNKPYYVAEVLNEDDEVVVSSEELLATPNANGVANADLTSAPIETLEFDIEEAGNYIIRFTNLDKLANYDEFLLLSCDLTGVGVDNVVTAVTTMKDDTIVMIYDINGLPLSSLQRGINIVKTANGTVKKIFIK